MQRLSEDRNFEEGALYAGKNALIYDSVQEEGNIYTVLKNSSKKYVDNFEVIKGELFYFAKNDQEKKWAQEIGIKVSPYIIIDGELMSSNTNLDLMDKATGTIIIPQNVTKIGNGAFRDLAGLRSIVIPGTVKEIGEYAFSGNPTLENVVIEEGVEKIGAYAFQQCTALKTIKIADSVSVIGSTCFDNCSVLMDINIPKSLKRIPARMLSVCSSLSEIEIPEGVTAIDKWAFELCTNLKKISISSTVTDIDGTAFNATHQLANIEISSNNNSFSFTNGSLMSKDGKIFYHGLGNMTEINIPETVEIILGGNLEKYPQRAVLNITKNVKSIETTISRNITSINVVEENPYFKSIDGNLYNKDVTVFYRYTQNKTDFTLPNTVKEIKSKAFYEEKNLTNLTLSDELEVMESWVFWGTKIEKLYLPKKVRDISASPFANMNITISIDDENPNYKTEDGTLILSKDGKKIIQTTKDLEIYDIPTSAEIIGYKCFYSRQELKSIVIPKNIKNIENEAFDACNGLQKVEISSSIENIGPAAFSRCNSLKEIIIDKKEGEISGAPWGCPYGLRAVFWKK